MINQYPYTNYQNANLDYILSKIGEVKQAATDSAEAIAAAAEAKESATNAATSATAAAASATTANGRAAAAAASATTANGRAAAAASSAAAAASSAEEAASALDNIGTAINQWFTDNQAEIAATLLDTAYPIGSVYITVSDTIPALLTAFTWEKIEDCFLLGSGTKTLGETGGAESVKLTADNIPRHVHNIFVPNAGGDGEAPIGFTTISSTKKTYYAVACTTGEFGGVNDSGELGNCAAFDIMPTYTVVNIWKRTA